MAAAARALSRSSSRGGKPSPAADASASRSSARAYIDAKGANADARRREWLDK